jgi:acetyltransferase-like isoleucine patch superfamily enzyme
VIKNSVIHPSVKIWDEALVNIYDSTIGEGTKIAKFVEIGGSKIGKHCKIEAFAFIPPGSIIEDYVFIGPHVCLTNDKYPNLLLPRWDVRPVHIKRGARIGAEAVILPGVVIGEEAMVGAGAVVTKNVLARTEVYGNPARCHRKKKKMGKIFKYRNR